MKLCGIPESRLETIDITTLQKFSSQMNTMSEISPSYEVSKSPIEPPSTAKEPKFSPTQDAEKQSLPDEPSPPAKTSAFKALSLLDRFLALWIFLAMLLGILLGNFVPNTGPALQKGKFVGVSIPIGMFFFPSTTLRNYLVKE